MKFVAKADVCRGNIDEAGTWGATLLVRDRSGLLRGSVIHAGVENCPTEVDLARGEVVNGIHVGGRTAKQFDLGKEAKLGISGARL